LVGFEAYLDESGTDTRSDVFVVAGYIVRSDAALIMDARWREVLAEYTIPYFHMVDCAHGGGIFKRFSKDERSEIAKKFIEIIREHVTLGSACIINPRRFDEEKVGADKYTFALHHCMVGLLSSPAGSGELNKISFFFEAGHESGYLAHKYIQEKSKEWIIPLFYAGHSFVKKAEVPAVQAADILAWHAAKFVKRNYIEGNKKLRKDYASLLHAPHMYHYFICDHRGKLLILDRYPECLNPETERVVTGMFSKSIEAEDILDWAFDVAEKSQK
jgi:hypothetical protein